MMQSIVTQTGMFNKPQLASWIFPFVNSSLINTAVAILN